MNQQDKAMIAQLKSEAEANYSASRWEDSAKTYEHLVGLAQNNNDFEQAIDFAIAAIRAWNKMPDMIHRINRLYQAIGLISLRKAAIGFEEIAIKEEEEKSLKNAANNFEEAGSGYCLIQSYDRAKQCYQSSVDIFQQIVKESSAKDDFESSIYNLDRIYNVYIKLATLLSRVLIERKDLDKNQRQVIITEKNNLEAKIIDTKKEKALFHEKLAQYYLNMKNPDCNPIAEKEYMNAIKILESIGDNVNTAKLKAKIEKIPK
ncbi:MAG: hypothetical protein JXA54_04755 [Candidatus Heimdallarchaeota archaeon]|nr:hypothetical protein [Candidatus Heimdallarchaeota archaeon]